MYEIVIDGVSYNLNFGMGFLRDINERVKTPIPGKSGAEKKEGLIYAIASVIDCELDEIEDILIIANKGCNPRLTKEILDSHIENPETDIDKFVEDVKGFLSTANATKKTVAELQKKIEEAKDKK